MAVPPSAVTSSKPGFPPALGLFYRAYAEVPAYKEFIDARGIDPRSIRTADDFASIPVVTKDSYLRRYPLADLVWGGDIAEAGTWSTSSGSSGAPTYWPRDSGSLHDSVELYDSIFRYGFQSCDRSTLLVIGFAMGNWIGGTYTYRGALELRRWGHRLSVIAPGIGIDTLLANITALGPYYDQVVIAGYPPFVKDVLDRADRRVLDQDLKILLAGESISEQWRDHVLDLIGRPGEAGRIRVMYGTADAGIMGYETGTTIALRRLARTDQRIRTALFGDTEILPTFVEYDPRLRYAEVDSAGRLLFTINGTLPLVRYQINDEGDIFSTEEISSMLRDFGYRLPVRTAAAGGAFLALRGRADVAASFYAVNLFPESVRVALEEEPVREVVSGKFVLKTEVDANFRQTLVLRVELRENSRPAEGFRDLLRRRVVAALDRTNSEYRQLRAEKGPSAEPVVVLEPFGTPRFLYETKHKSVEKN